MMWWLLLACGGGPPTERPPDLVLLSVDTLRGDHLGYAGHAGAHTPALDALAAESRVFTRASTPLPRTTPALASLHTGLLPHHHGSREVGESLQHGTTVASRLQAAGWQTLARSAMRVAGPDQGLDAGFEDFEVLHDAPAPDLVDAGLEAAADLDLGRSALVWLHFSDPHFPYLPHASSPLTPAATDCRKVVSKASRGKLRRAPFFADRGGRASGMLDQCTALYDAEISVVDRAIGSFLERWNQLRGDRDTWVVFTADHGEHLGEAGLYYEHGPDVHDANVHIPLLVHGPGITAGNDDRVARLEDVGPTLAQLAGLSAAPVDGTSLLAEPLDRLARIESGSALQVPLHGFLVSGRTGKWCLNDGSWSWCERKGVWTLHDRSTDPGLSTDVQAQHPEVVDRLTAAAQVWRPERARQRAVRRGPHTLVSTPQLDGSRIRELHGPAAEDAVTSALHRELDAFEAELDALDGPAERDASTLEALRQLGYVE